MRPTPATSRLPDVLPTPAHFALPDARGTRAAKLSGAFAGRLDVLREVPLPFVLDARRGAVLGSLLAARGFALLEGRVLTFLECAAPALPLSPLPRLAFLLIVTLALSAFVIRAHTPIL